MKQPERIVSISPNATETSFALGQGHRIIAVSDYCHFPPEIESLPRVGGYIDPDLERILSLAPDLVIFQGNNRDLTDLCKRQGISMYVEFGILGLADIHEGITELGRILGCSPAAEQLSRRIKDDIADVAGRVSGLPKPRVLITIARNPDRINRIATVGKGSFITELVTLAGGRGLFEDTDIAYPEVSPESILASPPEVIIEFMPSQEIDRELSVRVLERWATLGHLPAVENRRVFLVSDGYALVPGPRVALVLRDLARMIHPEVLLDD